MNITASLTMPRKAKRGETIAIKALVAQSSNSTLTLNAQVKSLVCDFNGKRVFAATFGKAIAYDPYVQFKFLATQSGVFKFKWTDNAGTVLEKERKLAVS